MAACSLLARQASSIPEEASSASAGVSSSLDRRTSSLASAKSRLRTSFLESMPLPKPATLRTPITLSVVGSHKPSLICLCLLSIYTALGTVFFHIALDLSWVDAGDGSVTTTTTVGYGDFNPSVAATTDRTLIMICTMLYILFGVGVIGACLGILISDLSARRISWLGKSRRAVAVSGFLAFLVLIAIGAVSFLLDGNNP